MKRKVLSLLTFASLTLILVMSLAACATPAPAPTPTATPTSKPTASPTPGQTFQFKYASYFNATHPSQVNVIDKFIEQVNRKSNGRIKVTAYLSESLGKSKDFYDMVAQGTADFAWVNPEYTPGRFPLSEVLSLPFANSSALGANLVAMEMRPYLEREYPEVKVLAVAQTIPQALGFRTKEVTNLEGMKGLKIRISGGVMSEAMAMLGAVPVALAAGEMYTGMERGTIDGLMLAFRSWSSYKISEVAKYGLEAGGLSSPSILFPMNKQSFAKLPPDLQQIVLETGALLPINGGRASDAEEIVGKAALQKSGIKINTLSTDEVNRWKKAVNPVYASWVERTKKLGLPAEEIMAAWRAAQEAVSLK